MKRVLLACAMVGCSTPSSTNDASMTMDASMSKDAASETTIDASNADDISAILDPIRQQNNLPALTGAVWRGSELVAIGVSGVRKKGDPTPATIDDKWHLGSDTKAMTATLVGLYVDKNQIQFTDTIAKLFSGETIDPGYANVTIEQLLQHRGGAPANMPNDIWTQMWADGAAPGALMKAVRSLISRAPAQAPGTYAYANAGYMIAGAALERITGSSWQQLMKNDLFTPLGMSSCGFGPPGTTNVVDQPWGHQMNGTPVTGVQADNPPSLGPAGTVHCSLVDWGKFLAVHLAGARGEKTIVSDATMKKLQTPPQGGDYACGWGIATRSWAGGITLNHSGSNTMWYATAWLAPQKNVTMVVATNIADGQAVDSAFGPLIQKYIP